MIPGLPRRVVVFLPLGALFLSLAGCAAPPDKEINQAQGAIDAARAAGAETYASSEHREAVDALEKARQAVSQRDYRLALSHALDARERAEAAARTAADEKARTRAGAEQAWQATQQALEAARSTLETARRARVPERRLGAFKASIDEVDLALAGIRARLDQGDVLETTEALASARTRLEAIRSEIDAAAGPRQAPRGPATTRR